VTVLKQHCGCEVDEDEILGMTNKESVVANFKVPREHLHGGTEEGHKMQTCEDSTTSRPRSEASKCDCETRALPTPPRTKVTGENLG
jgi:hypothetical protein